MTYPEFREWLGYHRAKFPGLGKWLARISSEHNQDDRAPSVDDVIASWARSLNRAGLKEAKQATDLLGDEESEPKGFDRHPMAVAGIARRLGGEGGSSRQRQFVDGAEVYRCRRCLDSGYVTIWTIRAMKAAREGLPVRSASYFSCAARCDCETGRRRDRSLAIFDPEKMLLFGSGLPIDRQEEPADLLAFVR